METERLSTQKRQAQKSVSLSREEEPSPCFVSIPGMPCRHGWEDGIPGIA